MTKFFYTIPFLLLCCIACQQDTNKSDTDTNLQQSDATSSELQQRLDKYVPVKLTTDIAQLSEKEKQMIPILIEAATIMDKLFWYEAYGEKTEALKETGQTGLNKFININYGPWDRLDGNSPFVEGVGEKPKGDNFYPTDMTKEEFEAADLPDKNSLYTFVRRDANGKLITVPYRVQ